MKRVLLAFVLWWSFHPLVANAAEGGIANESPNPEAQMQALKVLALGGDGRAALHLSADKHLSKKEQLYWATISAEDGFPPGLYNLGMFLSENTSDTLQLTRAKYWLKKAKAQGIALADFGLCEIDRKVNPAMAECQPPPDALKLLDRTK